MSVIIPLVIVACLIFVYFTAKEAREKRESLVYSVEAYGKQFNTSYLIKSNADTKFIQIDEKGQKIRFAFYNGDTPTTATADFSDIIGAEIIEDGTSIIKTARLNQAGGILIGEALGGGIGAVIGGLSSKKNVVQKVNSIQLRVFINDLGMPEFNMSLLGHEIDKTSSEYRSIIDAARRWDAMFKVIVNQGQLEDIKNKASF